MMLSSMQSNPSLVQTSDRHTNGDLSARIDGLKLDGPPAHFTYVPPDPPGVYTELLNRCLDWDLEVLKSLPEDEDVSLGVLSQDHVALLGECAVRWRLPPSFRAWKFLESIVERCEQGLVPSACVHEASAAVSKVLGEMPLLSWAVSDVSIFPVIKADAQHDGLDQTMARRNTCLFTAIDSALAFGEGGYHSLEFPEAVSDWLALDVRDAKHPSHDATEQSIADRIRAQAFQSYIQEASNRLEHEGSKNKAFALALAGWIEKEAKKLNKIFLDPITKYVRPSFLRHIFHG